MAEHQVMSWLPSITVTKRDLVSHVELSVYFQEHFVEMPSVSRSWRSAAQSVGVCLAELEAPFSDRLIADGNAAHR